MQSPAGTLGLLPRVTLALACGTLISLFLMPLTGELVVYLARVAGRLGWALDAGSRESALRALIHGQRHLVAMALLSTVACLSARFMTTWRGLATIPGILLVEVLLLTLVMQLYLTAQFAANPLPWRNAGGLIGLGMPAIPVALIFIELAAAARPPQPGP